MRGDDPTDARSPHMRNNMNEEIEMNEAEAADADAGDPLRNVEAENEALRQLVRLQDAREQITARLREAGARSPALLFAQAADELQFDEHGKLVNAAAILSHLKRSYPEQFESIGHAAIDGGAGRGSGSHELTKESLAKMTPAEIARLDWEEVRSVLASR